MTWAEHVHTVDPHRIQAMNESSTHGDPDDDRVEELVVDMAERGWVGAPVLVWGDLAFSGTHRIAAARQAGIQVPVLDIEDVLGDGAVGRLEQVMMSRGVESLEAAALLLRATLGDEQADALGRDLDTRGVRLSDLAYLGD